MFAWQATVQDEAGNAVPLPVVTVYEEDGGALADIYGEDGSPLENPFTGTMEGFVQFWAEPGKYRVSGVSGSGETQEWHIEGGGVDLANDALTAFDTRADMVDALDSLSGSQDGRVVWAGGLAYIRDSGSVDIPDMPGWKPVGVAEVANFGGDISSAHASAGGFPVDYGSVVWPDDRPTGYLNLYGSTKYRTADYHRIQSGLRVDPTITPDPLTAIVKFSGADRNVDPAAWDQVGYYGLVKVSGAAYGAALSASGRHDGGTGDVIAVHGRGHGVHRNAKVWGGWFYAAATNADDRQIDMIGVEINVNSKWPGPLPFVPNGGLGEGEYRGLVVATADGSYRANTAISINAQAGTGGFNHGLKIRQNTIAGHLDAGGKSGAILIEGLSSNSGGAATGIIFGPGYHRVGIDFRDMTQGFEGQTAINLKPGHRIRWQGDGDVARYIVNDPGSSEINLHNLGLSINGTRVLGPQRPAIPDAASGTEVETINTILSVLRSHGIIAT